MQTYQPPRHPQPVVPEDPYRQREQHLHRTYRRRAWGIRARWFTSGLVLGLFGGVLLTIIVSAVVITQIPLVVRNEPGDPDVSVVVSESYLNRAAAARVAQFSTGTDALTLTGLRLDLQPGNQMDLQPSFTADAIFFTVESTAIVKNQLTVVDGKLVIKMVGDPQLGNMDVPLDALPFDLKGSLTSEVDRINNDLLIAEINESLISGFQGTNFTVYDVDTENDRLTVRLKER